jgi:hypothetical protein
VAVAAKTVLTQTFPNTPLGASMATPAVATQCGFAEIYSLGSLGRIYLADLVGIKPTGSSLLTTASDELSH